jgi:hypothetical protein
MVAQEFAMASTEQLTIELPAELAGLVAALRNSVRSGERADD